MDIVSRAWGATVGRLADHFEAKNVETVRAFERNTGTPHWCRLLDENDTELWTIGWHAAAANPTELD